MSKIVFILGAGASHEDGAPLMHNFMDVARNLFNDNTSHSLRTHQKDLELALCFYESLKVLGSQYRASGDPQRNIESILGFLETCVILGDLPTANWVPNNRRIVLQNRTPEEIFNAFRVLIVKTLEGCIEFPRIMAQDQRILVESTKTYRSFALLIKEFLKLNENHQVSIITTNYDLMLDVALYVQGLKFTDHLSYCSPSSENSSLQEIRVHKMHGSLNWYKVNEDLYAMGIEVLTEKMRAEWNNRFIRKIRSSLNNKIPSSCFFFSEHLIGGAIPFIAVPTPNKSGYLNLIRKAGIWNCAAKDLKDAHRIILCGYSLPETDYLFRHFYGLGMFESNNLRKFSVYDPCKEDKEKGVNKRFQTLLNENFLENYYEYKDLKFGQAILDIGNEFKIDVDDLDAKLAKRHGLLRQNTNP